MTFLSLRKSCLLLALLFLRHLAGGQSPDASCPLSFGFRSLDTSQYAKLYVMREIDTTFQKYWFGLYMDKQHLVRTYQSDKYEIHVLHPGTHLFWTEGDKRTTVRLKLEYGKDYYLQLSLQPGKDHPEPDLKLLEETAGKAAFEEDTSYITVIKYPVPDLKKVPGTTIRSSIYYANNKDSLFFEFIQFSPPSWSNVVEFFEGVGHSAMSYFDSLSSPTYSEFALGRYVEETKFKDSTDFHKYLRKKALKGLLDKEDELIKEQTIDWKLPGTFNYVRYIEAKDLDAGNKGSNDFLLVRSFYSVLVVDKNETQKVYEFIYSERGKPEELWNEADFSCRAKDFLDTIKLRTTN